ncbi:MAG: hypothetical protein ABI472_03830 [Ginsengibacter sp.]
MTNIFYKPTHNLSQRRVECNPGVNFSIFLQMHSLKQFLLIFVLLCSTAAAAQKVDSIYVDLYTDSLKKGTYNYININGKLSNGRYIPLDTTAIIFSSSDGKFSGNSLWLDPGFNKEKVVIKAVLKSNPSQYKEFTMYIKKKPDDENLKTIDELTNGSKPGSKRPGRRRN